ncbi:DUF5407 family protein [Mycobacterium antarcticum]|uniref:DUF5407 family protein n=1 Tax=Mycolicibacterium sp. TUM20984 TaxID=3023368 RepID=UPI0024E060BF|nr:DUF5407 family protein [Mycolicibacterium sp. TUM20984]
MSFAGGVSFAEPDSGAAPPSDPSAASQQAPPGTTADSAGGSSDSTPADSSPGMGQGPTSKVGNEPTVGVNGSGGAQTSSEDLQTQEDALSSNMANLADVTAQISADDQQLASKVAEMKLQGGDSLSIADMLEMQAIMEHMNEMSQLSSAIVSQSNAALAGMATKVKE